jgi:nitrate reductase NapE component
LHIGRSLKWWYWLAAALALSAALAGWPAGLPLVFTLVGAQAAHFLLRERRPSAFFVQVPVAFLALLAIGLWGPLGFIHWMQLAGTWVRLVFDYCPLARIMSLMPWNLREPLSVRLVKRTFLARPVTGSILGQIPVQTAAGGSAAQTAA